MLKVVDKEIIRRLRKVRGWSERRIAREFGFARMTVREYLAEEGVDAPRYRLTESRAGPVLDPVPPLIRRWFEEDEQQPRKQRRTTSRMWEQLRDEYGFEGSEPSVRRAARELKQERRPVFIPLAFEPGERGEVGWRTARVILGGRVVEAHLFVARLGDSGMPLVAAFPLERQEEFREGRRRASAYWGGTPEAAVYDKLGTSVLEVLEGRGCIEQEAFVGLRMHYLYLHKSVFRNPALGNEKGSVEDLVGMLRGRYLSPMTASISSPSTSAATCDGHREFVRVLELCLEPPTAIVAEAVGYGACDIAAAEKPIVPVRHATGGGIVSAGATELLLDSHLKRLRHPCGARVG